MSTAPDESLRGLDDCGCCAGTGAAVPVAVENRPGLPAVAYRVGTHATFREHLLASLSARGERPADAPPGWTPPLRALSAREDDFTPALLGAWAAVGDVLTFYHERIANESWLRTATERRSVLRLARSIGYELAPGVAAATPLAFTLEDVPGSPARVPIAAGTRVQSVPGPGERPQTFETVEAVEARPEWNAWKARPTRPQALAAATAAVWVAGAPAPVAAGDVLLFVGALRPGHPDSGRWALRTAREVTVDAEGGRTLVALDAPLGATKTTVASADAPALYVLRDRAALFGQRAPDWNLLPKEIRDAYPRPLGTPPDRMWEDWPGLEPKVTDGGVDLDAVYPRLLKDSWLVMADPARTRLYFVTEVVETGRGAFGLSARLTRPVLDAADDAELGLFGVRRTTIYLQSEALALAEEPDPAPVRGKAIELDRVVDALPGGRRLIVRGRLARVRLQGAGHELRDAEGRPVAALPDGASLLLLEAPSAAGGSDRLRLRDAEGREGFVSIPPGRFGWLPAEARDAVVAEEAVLERREPADAAHTRLVLLAPLRRVYDRTTVDVLGNVAPATHGEAVEGEALGSGDAGLTFQRFALRQPPLTHVPDASPSGAASTLRVRVNEVEWREVPTLFGRGPQERVYATRRRDGDDTVVQFGDGREGARLPTGHENVRADYRRGIGRAGNLAAGQLSLLMTRALGVRGAENPLPASGGMDPQELDDARANAPLTVLTLDRVVSLRDYENFACAFAGIARAHAAWSRDGGRRGVVLTVAGPDGAVVEDTGRVAAAIAAAGDPHVPLRVRSCRRRGFRVAATLRREPDRLAAAVLRDAEAALHARFGFAARGFGQRVSLSEVTAVLQAVPGVAWVDLDLLYRDGETATLRDWLPADVPRPGADAAASLAAELLVIDLRPGDLKVAT